MRTKPRLMRLWFQHTAARRRLGEFGAALFRPTGFQHTAARRRLGHSSLCWAMVLRFQHTAARRRLVMDAVGHGFAALVSTHSRPKAAGYLKKGSQVYLEGFNTQPPEGGWEKNPQPVAGAARFNTQPPEGGWSVSFRQPFQTACFNTQPPEGGWIPAMFMWLFSIWFQHTAARRRLAKKRGKGHAEFLFQHTAARRRLVPHPDTVRLDWLVSTHSRPKAAGSTPRPSSHPRMFQHTAARRRLVAQNKHKKGATCFNTQPPEGGWLKTAAHQIDRWFQHTAARRRLVQT